MPDAPDPKKALKQYGLEQYQRKIERDIRKQRRAIEGTVDKELLEEQKEKLTALRAQMEEFLDANPQLRRNPRREQIYKE